MPDLTPHRRRRPPTLAGDLRQAGAMGAALVLAVVVLSILVGPILRPAFGPPPAPVPLDGVIRLAVPDRPEPPRRASPPRAARDLPVASPVGAVALRRAARRGRTVTRLGSVRRALGPATAVTADADADGMPDHWEQAVGLDPSRAADAPRDADGDGLTNRNEFLARTLPTRSDSDADGQADTLEDGDGDGAINAVEQAAGTDPGSDASVPVEPAAPTPAPTPEVTATPEATPTPEATAEPAPAETPEPAAPPAPGATPAPGLPEPAAGVVRELLDRLPRLGRPARP